MGKQIDAELRGESIFPVGDYRELKDLALRWARLDAHPDDRAMVGTAPHGYVRVAATVVFDRVDVPIVVALVPEGTGAPLPHRRARRARVRQPRLPVRQRQARRRQARDPARTPSDRRRPRHDARPSPAVRSRRPSTLQFTYCDGPIEIAEGAYGALPFAVAFAGNVAARPDRAAATDRREPLSIDLDPDALNALLHELWRTGWLDRRLAEAGLDRAFNSDPTVAQFLSVRISTPTLALAPVVVPDGARLRLAADARIAIVDEGQRTTGRVYGALDLALPGGVDLGALELSCEKTAATLVPCYGDLVAALRDRGADFHGALTTQFTRLVETIFTDRQIGGLPADLAIRRAEPSVIAGTLHLKLDAAIH